jgi:CheY-like chemotaxis protein
MGKRVLVVDDNRDTVVTTMEVLRTMGHAVLGCYDGAEAIERVVEFDPDVVIMDLAMPQMSGWNAASAIRERFPKRPVLIAVTGEFRGGADRILSHMVGFDHYILKPADPGVLGRLIEKAPAT